MCTDTSHRNYLAQPGARSPTSETPGDPGTTGGLLLLMQQTGRSESLRKSNSVGSLARHPASPCHQDAQDGLMTRQLWRTTPALPSRMFVAVSVQGSG